MGLYNQELLQVLAQLNEKNIAYELISTPRPIVSVKDGIAMLAIEAGQTAPTLILNTDKGFYAAIVSGARGKLDLQLVGRLLRCQNVSMATKEAVRAAVGYEPGQIPLIGHALPCILDKWLLKYDLIYGGTGQSTMTLKIKPQVLYLINEIVAELDC